MMRAYVRRKQYEAKLIANEVGNVVAVMFGAKSTDKRQGYRNNRPTRQVDIEETDDEIDSNAMLAMFGIPPPPQAKASE